MLFKKKTPTPPIPPTGLYDWASFEDRLAERAMIHFMEQKRLTPGGLEMDFEEVAKGAYRMARAMLRVSGRVR